MSYILSLPEEIIIEVIYHIRDYKDLLAIYEINKHYFNAKFWTSLFYNHFGNIVKLLNINFNGSSEYLMIVYSKIKESYFKSIHDSMLKILYSNREEYITFCLRECVNIYSILPLIMNKPTVHDFLKEINFNYAVEFNLSINVTNIKLCVTSYNEQSKYNFCCYFKLSELQYLHILLNKK